MSGSITGSTPNWVAGYVPPAGEWNYWWAKKMDADSSDFAGGPFMSLAGGQMTGPLLLIPGAPIDPKEAVNKAYVDSLTFAAGPFMPQTGGTFSGPVIMTSSLTLAGNPVNPLDAAPRQYVDAATSQANNALNIANAAVRRAGDTMTGLLTLSSDPVAANNAATKSYADSKVAKAGDTMTGQLTLNSNLVLTGGGNLYNGGNLYVNGFNSWEWSFSVGGNGDHYQTYRTGYYDMWASATGTRIWVSGNSTGMVLDPSGNLGVKAGISATGFTGANISLSGGISIAGTADLPALNVSGYAIYNNGNQTVDHGQGWQDLWRPSDGARIWLGNGIVQMVLNNAGDLGVHGAVTGNVVSGSAWVSGGALYAAGNNIVLAENADARTHQYQTSWYWQWLRNNGDLRWVISQNGEKVFWNMRMSDHACFNELGRTGGYGPYWDLSDVRSKADIVPATCGLAEILRIEPIEFSRVNPDGSNKSRDIGFSAQALREVIPLAVSPMGIKLPDGSGGLDTDEPSLGIVTEPIIAALVNGMKELASEIAALKAAR